MKEQPGFNNVDELIKYVNAHKAEIISSGSDEILEGIDEDGAVSVIEDILETVEKNNIEDATSILEGVLKKFPILRPKMMIDIEKAIRGIDNSFNGNMDLYQDEVDKLLLKLAILKQIKKYFFRDAPKSKEE